LSDRASPAKAPRAAQNCAPSAAGQTEAPRWRTFMAAWAHLWFSPAPLELAKTS
jgi:hypothetical protein